MISTPGLIVTADDFGFDASVNAAVVRSFDLGLVTHSSLLVNLKGFREACDLIAAGGWQDRVGLHVNLTEGPSLTDGIRKTALCADGRFVPIDRFRYYQFVSVETRRAVAAEVAAQIAAARDAGIPVTHLDSHNDVHTAPSIARVVAEVAITVVSTGCTSDRSTTCCGCATIVRTRGLSRRSHDSPRLTAAGVLVDAPGTSRWRCGWMSGAG